MQDLSWVFSIMTEFSVRVRSEKFGILNHRLNCFEGPIGGSVVHIDSFKSHAQGRYVLSVEANNILADPLQFGLLVKRIIWSRAFLRRQGLPPERQLLEALFVLLSFLNFLDFGGFFLGFSKKPFHRKEGIFRIFQGRVLHLAHLCICTRDLIVRNRG